MKTFSMLSIEPLLQNPSKICISIYMPAHRGGPETQQDPIRLRNLISQAATKLVRADMETDEINELLAPASSLLENQDFWKHQSEGLVLFLGKNFLQYHRLPVEFEEFVSVSQEFYIKPLLSFLNKNGTYYILAASQNRVSFFEATYSSIQPLELEGLPTSLNQALQYDNPEKQLQSHSGQSSGGTTIYHGQGKSDPKTDILRFFQAVDRGLQSTLSNTYIPMIFIGVDYLFPIYQEANSYPTLLEQSIQTNPDTLHPATLHKQTLPVAQAYFEQAAHYNKRRYQELVGSNYTSDQLTDILNAAHDGQVETLFLASGHHKWGTYDAESRVFTERSEDGVSSSSVLNLAAVYTFNCGGQVFVMDVEEMPSNTVAAAILRYPMPKKLVYAA